MQHAEKRTRPKLDVGRLFRRERGCELRFWPVCGRGATAVGRDACYAAREILTVQRRVPAMMALVVSEGRLLWLKPSEWSLLLISAAFCGMLTLIF
jgi:hypothetical protein